jgi:geranylgeranyl pyrophosphate synthase
MSQPSAAQRLDQSQARIERALSAALPADQGQSHRLFQAMRYSSLNGGKRLRPALCFATAECFDQSNPSHFSAAQNQSAIDAIAAAIEMIHVYSLIHDDLPAMDDDDLRRGQPTCHKQFNEAIAILAGDALHTQAFLTLSNAPLPADIVVALIRDLAQAAGAQGMVLGQAIDLAAMGLSLNLTELKAMHEHKTGALLTASIVMSARTCGATPAQLTALTEFGFHLGLCFQIVDDILDVTSSTEVLGKTVGADHKLNKPTYPSMLGLEHAKQLAAECLNQAQKSLQAAALPNADPLWELARFVVERDH